MIAIVDYGLGNLRSVENALRYLGHRCVVSHRAEDLAAAKRLILPGVGAFAVGMQQLRARGLVEVLEREVRGKGKPILGICLGAQLFARASHEGGETPGLGWIDATVERMVPADPRLKIPHVGWNSLALREDPLFQGIGAAASFYFVHSYYLRCHDPSLVIATLDYGGTFTAAVRRGNIAGTQFHPEKSKNTGLSLLRNFAAGP